MPHAIQTGCAAQRSRSWRAQRSVTPTPSNFRDNPEPGNRCKSGARVSGHRKRLCLGRSDGDTRAGTIPFARSGPATSVHSVAIFNPIDEYAVSTARRPFSDHPLRLHGSIRPAKLSPANALRDRLNFASVLQQAAHDILPAREPTPSERSPLGLAQTGSRSTITAVATLCCRDLVPAGTIRCARAASKVDFGWSANSLTVLPRACSSRGQFDAHGQRLSWISGGARVRSPCCRAPAPAAGNPMRAGSVYRGFRVARESAHRVAAPLHQSRTIRCARAAFIVDFGWKRESAHRYSERDVSGR